MSRYAYTVLFALLLTALTATHWKAYTLGRDFKQAEYSQAIAAASEQARQREQELIQAKQQVEVRYAQLKKRLEADAAGARSELERLRDELARQPRESAAPSARTNGAAGLERQLLGTCAQALVGLGAEADRLAARLVGLQQYVSQVCLKQ